MTEPTQEKAWYFKAGDPIPQWLEKTERCEAFAGTDILVTSKNGGYEVRPQRYPMGPDDCLMRVIGEGDDVDGRVIGGGNGVDFIGSADYGAQHDGRETRVSGISETAALYGKERDAMIDEIRDYVDWRVAAHGDQS